MQLPELLVVEVLVLRVLEPHLVRVRLRVRLRVRARVGVGAGVGVRVRVRVGVRVRVRVRVGSSSHTCHGSMDPCSFSDHSKSAWA